MGFLNVPSHHMYMLNNNKKKKKKKKKRPNSPKISKYYNKT